jgi:hypothetical protein
VVRFRVEEDAFAEGAPKKKIVIGLPRCQVGLSQHEQVSGMIGYATQEVRVSLLRGLVRINAVNLIENARSSHEFHECHETLSLSVAHFLALFVYFVQFVAVLVLPKQAFHLKLTALRWTSMRRGTPWTKPPHFATSQDYPPVWCPRWCINGSRTRAGT